MGRKLEYIMLREEDGGRAEYGPEQEDDGRIRLVCARQASHGRVKTETKRRSPWQ